MAAQKPGGQHLCPGHTADHSVASVAYAFTTMFVPANLGHNCLHFWFLWGGWTCESGHRSEQLLQLVANVLEQ